MVTMVWVVCRFRLKAPPGISSSCISPLTSSGQSSRASWASQPQKSATLSPQPGGKPRKFIRTCDGIGGGGMLKATFNDRTLLPDFHHLLRKLFTNILASTFRVVQNDTTLHGCLYQKCLVNKFCFTAFPQQHRNNEMQGETEYICLRSNILLVGLPV